MVVLPHASLVSPLRCAWRLDSISVSLSPSPWQKTSTAVCLGAHAAPDRRRIHHSWSCMGKQVLRGVRGMKIRRNHAHINWHLCSCCVRVCVGILSQANGRANEKNNLSPLDVVKVTKSLTESAFVFSTI